MLVGELLAVVERLAPPDLAEDWDNVGLMVGRHNARLRRILVALELRDEVLGEAAELGCEAVVVHHPPIFPTLRAVTDAPGSGELVLRAAEHRVAVIAAHTNLDSARGGLNDVVAEALGMRDTVPLTPAASDPGAGIGRVGRIEPVALERLVAQVNVAFGGRRSALGYVGDLDARVERLALCTGSGGGLIADARAAGADAYVTGDLRYHDADRALGMALVQVPHAGVERFAMRRWSRTLERALTGSGLEVRFAETDTDPWQAA
ncbi:MAG: Nif3-like dinuclear metal center hexameric protein [Thermoleophilia bacterium]|jgi:dinuclear metal center YbgI/SA1388 family protein|nr:Nif3-like dinuclear metal center hexameric protein [Thermoleophilia bacterium]